MNHSALTKKLHCALCGSFRTLVLSVLFCALGHAKVFEFKEHYLGPCGFYGNISPSSIEVVKIEKESPADGKLKSGDVIVSAAGLKFQDNTRKQFALAIHQAESNQRKGELVLKLQSGNSVTLNMPVLGSFTDTAPYQCPKTDAIIERAADEIVRTKAFGRLGIGMLGLLATGEEKYLAVVREAIHAAKWAMPDVELTLSSASNAWGYGYTNLLLCEYYLQSGDRYVLPAIEAYSKTIARGRDAAGLWGHRMADPGANRGELHGRLFGYAVMNQSSLPLFISLVMARKCGVNDPEVMAAIEQNHTFYASFVGKGTLPYGVHNPNSKSFNNNGMSALAALALSLYGDDQGAAFFSKMSLAAHQDMETGHTGHYFNQMWTGLGAGLAGPHASARFFKETNWMSTLNRSWTGRFSYDSSYESKPNYSYRDLSSSGAHLLNYCISRHALYITGKEANKSLFLSAEEVGKIADFARLNIKSMSDDELLAAFDHPLPKIRIAAVWELRSREHSSARKIIKMLSSGSKLQRLSAMEYYGYGCPTEKILEVRDDLVTILRNESEPLEIRVAAASSLCCLGPQAYDYYDDLLRLVLLEKPQDPLGEFDEKIGFSLVSLCSDPYAAGLVKDKKLFYAVVHKLMQHRRTSGRSSGVNLVANISLDEFYHVADALKVIIDDKDLTYHSYHSIEAKTAAIGILANLKIEGGIEAAFATLEDKTGKYGFKIRLIMAIVPKYGASAKPYLPQLRAIKSGKFQKQWDQKIKDIEMAKGATQMISFEEAKSRGKPNK